MKITRKILENIIKEEIATSLEALPLPAGTKSDKAFELLDQLEKAIKKEELKGPTRRLVYLKKQIMALVRDIELILQDEDPS